MKRLLALAALGLFVLPLAAPYSFVARAAGDEPKSKPLLEVQGEITSENPKDAKLQASYAKIYEFKMEQGKGYKIDLSSDDFDTFLRVENDKGKELAFNDD